MWKTNRVSAVTNFIANYCVQLVTILAENQVNGVDSQSSALNAAHDRPVFITVQYM